MSGSRAVAAIFATLLFAVNAEAEDPPELRYRLAIDIPVTSAAAAFLVTTQIFESSLAPASCRWCETAADGSSDVNALDRSVRSALRWSNTGSADVLSSMNGFVVTPIAMLGLDALAASHEGRLGDVPADGLILLEATLLSMDVNQVVKFAVGRERPFVHALTNAEKAQTANPADNNTSFYSGHTNLAFTLAVASGTVATMRGYRWAPVIWITGLGLATFTGYLRIAADRHYFTDVVTGAAVGSLFGFGIPRLFHSPVTNHDSPRSVRLAPAVGSFGGGTWVGVGGAW